MKSLVSVALCFLLIISNVQAQLKSPDQFLGYSLGSHFTNHEKVVAYFKHVASSSENIKVIPYGKTYEGRELLVAVVSSKENMGRVESIRLNNLKLTVGQAARESSGLPANQPAILWLSYNVHGNEASSTETAMKTLYTLAQGSEPGVAGWLKNTVVILDPCLNPDGRERYVNFYNSVADKTPNADPMSREHFEPWPGGRPNHYYFDLNRDWAWQSQIESQQRVALYHQWMPEVHVDFHEQSYNDPYYFAPAAEPVHQDITPWQRQFQVVVGKNNAKYFDHNGWQYFTKERFDLLYPAYGDTYPLYNGAIGMTYEQGGSGRGGLAVVTASGDTLTLKDRIDHHYTTGMATVETVSTHADKLLREFKKYFEQSVSTPPGAYRSYVVKGDDLSKIKKLSALLKRNNIAYGFGSERRHSGFNFETRKVESFQAGRNDLVINLQQPKAVLVNVLMEPNTVVSDSNTYDITAWALPYAYGLKAYGLKESLKGSFSDLEETPTQSFDETVKPYAWVFPWKGSEDALMLIALQQAKIKVRVAEEGFTAEGTRFDAGSLLVYRMENEKAVRNLSSKLADITSRLSVSATPISTGFVEKGKDFGSSVYPLLKTAKVGVVSGNETSSQSLGQIWHFFEQELNYPLMMVESDHLANLDINKVNVLIVPDGAYPNSFADKIDGWINSGGKVILLEDAISSVVGRKPFDIKRKELAKEELSKIKASYDSRHSENHHESIPGAIFKVDLDKSHPLSYGLGNVYYTLKTDDKIYEPLENGWSVGELTGGSHMSGVAGKTVRAKLKEGMLFGVQSAGKGKIIYLGADILFRSFWENGKQMMLNAVFMVN